MAGWLGGAYLWVKAAHVVFVIFWMAGLFMLPRYLVYHQEALAAGRADEAGEWVVREGKLRRIILTPALVVTWVLGPALAVNYGILDGTEGLGWLHAKIAIVLALSAYHGWAVGYGLQLAAGVPTLTGGRLRFLNEMPAFATIAIVVLVIVKP